MRKFIFIFSIIFSNLSFSGESIEIFLDEQHKNLFDYIEKNIELIDEDKNLFVAGFEKSIEDLIDPREISKRVMGKKIYQFGFGQSPFPVPEKIVEALKKNAHRKEYLPIQGLLELRENISKYLYTVSYTHLTLPTKLTV